MGRGGNAIVFRARDLRYQRRAVAIKVLRPELSASPERFLQEIEILTSLQHPNITPLFDSGEADGLPYYVMPFVAGESLRHRLTAHARLPIAEALEITRVVAAALGYAHRQGIVHRDVKPENILLCEGTPLVTDFGIARAIQRSVQGGASRTSYRIGTPMYMSPEQLFGGEIDGRTDQYGLALVLVEMLTGGVPSAETLLMSAVESSTRVALRKVAEKRRDVPAHVMRALGRALAPSRDDRFDSMEAFAAALGERRAEAVSWRWIAGVAAVALVVVGVALWQGGGAAGRLLGRGAAELDPRRVAVLYLEDQTAGHALGYLADGLTERLIHELTDVHGITVISPNGVKRFRNREARTVDVARALGVGSLVEGSLQESEGRIRLNVRLVDGATDTPVEGATIEHAAGELFALEDDLARQVARLLRRRIGETIRLRERAAATRSVRARELVYRAEEARRDAAGAAVAGDTIGVGSALETLGAADSLLHEAEREDPRWTEPTVERGWVALEVARLEHAAARAAAFDSALAIASRLLARDSGSAAGLELRGTAVYHETMRLPIADPLYGNLLARAQHDLERSVARDSSLATAWGSLSRVLVTRGEIEKGERAGRIALSMDAYLTDRPDILLALYAATLMRDSLPASWSWCEQGAADFAGDVRFVECRLTLLAEDASRSPDTARADSLFAAGSRLDPPEHARAIGRLWLPVYRLAMTAIVHARAGDVPRARAMFARAREMVGDDREMGLDLLYERAFLALTLGDRRTAVTLLASYLEARPSLARLVSRHPRWRALRGDVAFQDLLRSRLQVAARRGALPPI